MKREDDHDSPGFDSGGADRSDAIEESQDWIEPRPEITVITRTYNSETVVSRALESGVDQTIDDALYEILVVDDGSDDGTAQTVSDFVRTHPGLVRFVQTEHTGAISTLNRGIEEAPGKYVILLDSDDTFEPEILERLYDALDGDPSVDFAYCDYYERSPDGEVRRVDVSSDLYNTVASGILFQREDLLEVNGYDEDLVFPEYDLLKKFERAGLNGKHIGSPLFTYYRHDDSLTADTERVRRGRNELREKYGEIVDFREY